MKWIGITGSWRRSCPELEQDLRREVSSELERGSGIVTGGALGVDYEATELTLAYASTGRRLKVFLPTTLDIYAAHYEKRALEGVISREDAVRLITQLETVKSIGSLIVNPQEVSVDARTYYQRNTEVVQACDELLAFQVNGSQGTQDTIDKARELGKPVRLFTYQVE